MISRYLAMIYVLRHIRKRQREGIAIAKRDGKYKGGKAKTVADFADHYSRYKTREITKSALARQLGVSRPTLDRLIAEHESTAGIIHSG